MEDRPVMLMIAIQKMIFRSECIIKCLWKTIQKMQKAKYIIKSRNSKNNIFKMIKLKNNQLNLLNLLNHSIPLGQKRILTIIRV